MVRATIVPIIVAAIHHAHVKHTHVHEGAFVKVEFPLFIPAVPREDTQRFVFSDRWITAHGLVVDHDPAVHTAASDQIFENIGDVVALIPEAVIGAYDLPAFFLSATPTLKMAAPIATMKPATRNTPRRFVS